MTKTKQTTSQCVGYGRDGLLIACTSPSLPVGRGGRCSRCDQMHRRGTLAHADQFASINDSVLPGEIDHPPHPLPVAKPAGLFALFDAPVSGPAPYSRPAPEPEPVAAKPWHSLWPACCLCGRTKHPHATEGCCTGCAGNIYQKRKHGTGLALLWVPFVIDDATRYDLAAAKRWIYVSSLERAAIYLERRAAAGGLPTGGKVIIRATKDADRLPERVIRPVAA